MRGTLSLVTLFFFHFFSIAQSMLPTSEAELYNAYRINSSDFEFSPTYYQNGLVYVATNKDHSVGKDNKNRPVFELLYAPIEEDGMPGMATPLLGPLTSLSHEGQASFSKEGDLIYFTGNSQTKNKQGQYTMKIYEARKEGSNWAHLVDLPFNSETYSNRHPAISSDGRTLIFASTMPGGFGGSDLYVVKKEGTYWGIPQNLGAQVNTPENDAFPFIYQDQYLFFSSKGHKGKGDYDIYAINIEDDLLGDLLPLNEKFNTPNADFGFILDSSGTNGFFSSNREGGYGKDDIYLFETPQGFLPNTTSIVKEIIQEAPNFVISPEVEAEKTLDIKQEKPIEQPTKEIVAVANKTPIATNNLDHPREFSAAKEQEIFTAKSVQCAVFKGNISSAAGHPISNTEITIRSSCGGLPYTLLTDNSGTFESCLPIHCQYIIAGSKEGFNSNDIMVDIKEASQFSKKIILSPIQKTPNFPTARLTDQLTIGSTIDIRSIVCDLEKGILLSTENYDLNLLISLLKQHPSMFIEVIEHTDARGSAYYNYELSQARARIFKNHLIQQEGIDPKRITSIGMGEQQLRNDCNGSVPCSDEEHQENRRTEIRITKLASKVAIDSW